MEPLSTQYPVHDLIRSCWSPAAFAAKLVEPEKLRTLFEAARWAPSSFNEQPWSFIVATHDSKADFERVLSCLLPADIEWSQNAPVLILSIAKLQFTRDRKPNRHAFHDVGLAVGTLMLQATSLGLSLHQMAGFHLERVRKRSPSQTGTHPWERSLWGTLPVRRCCQNNCRNVSTYLAFVNPWNKFIRHRWGQVSSLVGNHLKANSNRNSYPSTTGETNIKPAVD
jgi:hypothetical protein